MDPQPGIEQLIKQGRDALRQRNYPEAVQAFEQALSQSEHRTDIRSLLATTFFIAKKYDQAVQEFLRITQLDPTDGKAHINLGAVYNRIGEHQKAIEVLRRGMRLEKNSAEAYYNLGIAYKNQKQTSMAISAYREAIRFNPGMADAHQNLANVYSELGNKQQAINHYKKALEINPAFERARAGLSKALGEAEVARKAENPFGRLVDLDKYAGDISSEPVRELNETQRFEDRQQIYRLTKEIQTTSNAFLEDIRQNMIPALLSLGRSVASLTDDPFQVQEPHTHFQTVMNRNQELRRELKRKLLELRAHEELLNTPDLPGGDDS